jgi:hypothetical protein
VKPTSNALIYKKCKNDTQQIHSKEKSYALILQYTYRIKILWHTSGLHIKLTKLSTRLTIISVKPEQNTQKNAYSVARTECPNQHNNQLRAVGRHGNRAAKQFSALVEGEREQRDQRHSADQTGDLLRRLPLVALGDQLRQDRHQGDVQEAAGGEGNYPGGPLLCKTKKSLK